MCAARWSLNGTTRTTSPLPRNAEVVAFRAPGEVGAMHRGNPGPAQARERGPGSMSDVRVSARCRASRNCSPGMGRDSGRGSEGMARPLLRGCYAGPRTEGYGAG